YTTSNEYCDIKDKIEKCDLNELERIHTTFMDDDADIFRNIVRSYKNNRLVDLFWFGIRKSSPDTVRWVGDRETP
ncbi:hypothetical protein KKB18_05745, partial [bacterium]|nr:hypothetical protein [bacterium]